MIKMYNNVVNKPEIKKILTACIGQCVHIAGPHNFTNIAKTLGFKCVFLGPATPTTPLHR